MSEHFSCVECCPDDSYIKSLVSKHLDLEYECSACSKSPATPIDDVAIALSDVFREHLARADTEEAFHKYHEISGDSLDGVLQELGIDHPWSEWLANGLEGTDDYDDQFYELGNEYRVTPIDHHQIWNEWIQFTEIAMSGASYFNAQATKFLENLLGTIREGDLEEQVRVLGVKENLMLFRGREFDDINEALQAVQNGHILMAAPPPEKAAGQRMSVVGSSVLYAALDRETVMRELRPAVGSVVGICGFTPVRELRVLDLTALKNGGDAGVGSLFDPKFLETVRYGKFLSQLGELMSRAVTPGRAVRGYRPTQMIANYIENALKLDGIIWKTAQGGDGLNIALFANSNLVLDPLEDGGEIVVEQQYEWDEERRFLAGVKISQYDGPIKEPHILKQFGLKSSYFDTIQPSLKMMLDKSSFHKMA